MGRRRKGEGWGGKREGAGRPPLPRGERKVPLTLTVQQGVVDRVGGPARAREIATAALEALEATLQGEGQGESFFSS